LLSAVPPPDEGQRPVAYEKIAVLLGSLVRARRVALGRMFLDAAKEAASNSTGMSHATVHSPSLDLATVLLCTSHGQDQRGQRAQLLHKLALIARSSYSTRRVLGIATERAGQMGSSFDFGYVEG
jgi:hypothetical protein